MHAANPSAGDLGARWLAAAWCALLLGGFATAAFHAALLEHVKDRTQEGGLRVPPSLTGFVERLFFLGVIAFSVNGAASAMVTWIVVKMAANWNSEEARVLRKSATKDGDRERQLLNSRFTALLSTLVAMTFAMVGGVMVTGVIAVNWYTADVLTIATVVAFIEWSHYRGKRDAAPAERIAASRNAL